MKKQIKLFCLPYAGGSAKSIYSKWKESLDSAIELHPVELAGRGPRIGESLYSNVEEAVEDVISKIRNQITDCDYAIFGHSMGSILAYKVIQRINELKLPPPIHSFFSGRRAPHCPSRRPKPFSEMNTLELEKEIKELGGTPPEFFEYPELKNIFMPIIKSDFKIADTFVESSDIVVFNHEVSVFIGKEEDVTTIEAEEWMHHTNKKCSVEYFEGGHFFLLEEEEGHRVIDTINNCLINKHQYISM